MAIQKPPLKCREWDEPPLAKPNAWYLSAFTRLVSLIDTYTQSLGRFFHCDGVLLHWVISGLLAITADHLHNTPVMIEISGDKNARAQCPCSSASGGMS